MRHLQASGLWATTAFLTLITFGCGGGGGGGSHGGGGSLTTAQRTAAINDIFAKYQSLPHQNPHDDAVTMVAYIKGKPEFSDAGEAPDFSIWAVFTDGLIYGIINNDPGPSRSVPIRSAGTSRSPTLPGGNDVRLMDGFLDTRPDISNDLLGMLIKAGGYNVLSGSATVDAFKAVQNTGVLFTNLHGGHFPSPLDTNRSTTHLYCVTETNPLSDYDKPSNPLFADWKSGRMIVAGMEGQPMVYCIGPGFVQAYMSFANYSVWISNACSGFDQEFYEAAFHKGLSAYVGWDAPVLGTPANSAAKYIIDRLTGANLDSNHIATPPGRAFELAAILAGMASLPGDNPISNPTMDHTVWLNISNLQIADAHLRYAVNSFANAPPDQFAILAPSINYMDVGDVADNKNSLNIHGRFGITQGTVTIDGTPANVTSWSPYNITCDLPPPGQAGEAGDVVVDVNGHKSNTVQLTEWPVVFHTVSKYDFSGQVKVANADQLTGAPDVYGTPSGSFTITSDVKVWFRLDVHDSRGQPGEQRPFANEIRAFALAHNGHKTNLFEAAGWTVNGTTQIDINWPQPWYQQGHETATQVHVATGSPPVLFDGSDPNTYGTATGQIDATLTNLTFYLEARGLAATQQTSSTLGPPFSGYLQELGPDTFHVLPLNTPPPPGNFTFTLDGGYNIQSGSQSAVFPYPSSGYTENITISWSTTAPIHPPDDNSARSIRLPRRK